MTPRGKLCWYSVYSSNSCRTLVFHALTVISGLWATNLCTWFEPCSGLAKLLLYEEKMLQMHISWCSANFSRCGLFSDALYRPKITVLIFLTPFHSNNSKIHSINANTWRSWGFLCMTVKNRALVTLLFLLFCFVFLDHFLLNAVILDLSLRTFAAFYVHI